MVRFVQQTFIRGLPYPRCCARHICLELKGESMLQGFKPWLPCLTGHGCPLSPASSLLFFCPMGQLCAPHGVAVKTTLKSSLEKRDMFLKDAQYTIPLLYPFSCTNLLPSPVSYSFLCTVHLSVGEISPGIEGGLCVPRCDSEVDLYGFQMR